MNSPVHPRYMERALGRALNGAGRTGTNPLVGACLVDTDGVLAEAAHRRFGGPHAEAALLDEVDGIPSDAVLYVTLEPCVHDGKTPPCVPRILQREVDRLVYAHRDTDPRVDGQGLERLRQAGVRVSGPLRRPEYRWLNRAYFYRQRTGWPWLELKLALSGDGYIALESGESQWITGPGSRAHGHRLRSRADAVMVGAQTVRQDDPRLTDRVTGRHHQPRAVVVARSLDALPSASHLMTERPSSVILLVPKAASSARPAWVDDRGITVVEAPTCNDRFAWPEALSTLAEVGLGRILVEGGSFLAGTLLDAGVVNELHLFYSGRLFGEGIASVGTPLPGDGVTSRPRPELLEVRRFEQDVYVRRLFRSWLSARGIPDGFVSGVGMEWIRAC